MSSLAHRAETHRLATLLHVEADAISFCDDLEAKEIRSIRTSLRSAAIESAHDKLHRIAAASKVIPMGVAATVAEKSLSPRLCAKMSAVLDPAHAAKMVDKVSPDFVRRIGQFADPDETAPLLRHVEPETVVRVSAAMAEAGAWETIGCLLHIVDDATVAASLGIAEEPSDALTALLMLEEPEQIGRVLAACPKFSPDDLRSAAEEMGLTAEADELLSHL